MVNAKGKYLGAIWPFKLCLDTFTIWLLHQEVCGIALKI